MFSRPWTEEERSVLMELAKKGYTASQVSKELRRSKNSVLGFANRQFGGFTVVKPTKELKPLHVPKKVQKPRADGLSPTGRSQKRRPDEEIEALFPDPTAHPDHKPVRMLKSGRLQCKYIVSSLVKDHNPLMCGAPVKGTGSWCPFHHNLIFIKPMPKKA